MEIEMEMEMEDEKKMTVREKEMGGLARLEMTKGNRPGKMKSGSKKRASGKSGRLVGGKKNGRKNG